MADAMRCITLKEFEQEWRTALASLLSYDHDAPSSDWGDANDDPFDCSDIAIPPLHAHINNVVQSFVDEWRELDERKIVERTALPSNNKSGSTEEATIATTTNSSIQDESGEPPQKMARIEGVKLPRWYIDRVRLPEQFDYQSRLAEPPLDDGQGDRVVSLTDPTETLSYHTELWKLFKALPTVDQMEIDAISNHKLPVMEKLCAELASYGTRYDGMALSRLRYNDRHDSIPPSASERIATIQFECWKRNLKRGSSPDPSKMSIEFLGSQTLEDFHLAIIELGNDELWQKVKAKDKTCDESGFFFIEGTFYTYGSVDYVGPIQAWLVSGTEKAHEKRASYLGLTSWQNLPVKPMSSMRLEDLAMRLAVRYVHVCHGDVECSVFCVDRCLGPRAATPYPILHDIWTPACPFPDCEACQSCPAIIATSTKCERTLGHALICEACSRKLKLQVDERDKVELYSVWRGQGELSMGVNTDRFF